jgi:hypothetical protein
LISPGQCKRNPIDRWQYSLWIAWIAHLFPAGQTPIGHTAIESKQGLLSADEHPYLAINNPV